MTCEPSEATCSWGRLQVQATLQTDSPVAQSARLGQLAVTYHYRARSRRRLAKCAGALQTCTHMTLVDVLI